MTSSRWRPLHDGHSISEMSLTLQLDKAIGPVAFSRIENARPKFEQLPGITVSRLPLGMPNLSGFFSQTATNVNTDSPIISIRLSRSMPSGLVAEQVLAQNNVLTYTTTEYTRWSTISESALKNLILLIDAISEAVPTHIAIAYIDKFIHETDRGKSPVDSLVRSDAMDVAGRVISSTKPCHSFTGFFHPLSLGNALVNTNFQIADESESTRIASLTTYVSYPIGGTNFDNMAISLKQCADEVHDLSKMLLSGILSDQMRARIGLAT